MNVRCVPLPKAGSASSLLAFVLSVLVGAGSAVSSRAQSSPDSEAPVTAKVDLPDAPVPSDPGHAPLLESSSAAYLPGLSPSIEPDPSLSIEPGQRQRVPLEQCPYDKTGAHECRIHWRQLLIESSLYTAAQDDFNLYTSYWYRWETVHGKWFDRWLDSDNEWRWDHWKDDNPFLDDYIGHPMMGSITNYMWIQNDPKGATVDFGNNRVYWKSRMRALAFSTAFSFQWKLGPFGEAGVGHNGDHFYYDKGVLTNETGWVELVTTPVGGLGWTILEDAVDKHFVRKLQQKPRGALTLLAISFLTPSRGTANILRFRPPWYRDAYVVKAHGFWSDPPGTDGPAHAPGDMNMAAADPAPADPAAASPSSTAAAVAPGVVRTPAAELPEWPRYGGKHEFGAWWGLSLITAHVWGSAPDTKYMPIVVNYSYLLNPDSRRWAFRYAPEVTALAMLDELNPTPKDRYTYRTRGYGSGLNPVGFRASFFPESRVQPYLSTNEGFVYFYQPVLYPDKDQMTYNVDVGGGLTFFRKQRQSVSLGYRFQHIQGVGGDRGTDTNTFYVQVSRYRTKGYR
jgi:hypothetical protein